MCGINGFTFKDDALIQKMNTCIKHRGPDQTGFWCNDGISFGHDRLSIIDLSDRGRQPMRDADGRYVIVFNGEIYNFAELKIELQKKYTFVSESDTEVILYAYREYGAACLNKFNGIFALAIWDTATSELFLARDQMGIKPLYYSVHEGKLFFSSEIKSLLAAGVPKSINKEATTFFFNLLYIPEPLTLFEGIFKLPAAHYALWKQRRMQLTRYWKVTNFNDLKDRTAAVDEIATLFDDAVRGQLISDRPVGVFLSGGLDSTAIVGAAKKYSSGSVKTFSVGFDIPEENHKFNADFMLARKTAAYYGTEHNELVVSANDIKNNLSRIAWHLDQPNFNPTAGAIFLLAEAAKKQVAVVLGGDGADELFGGYPRYYYSRLLSKYQMLPRSFQVLITRLLNAAGYAKLAHKSNLPPNTVRALAFLAQDSQTVGRFLHSPYTDQTIIKKHFSEKYFKENQVNDFEKQFMNLDRQSWLVDESLQRTDTMTMAFGLEERVPILDKRLVELAYQIPTAWKIDLFQGTPRNFQGKSIWRDAIMPYLPPHVLNQKKRGWFTPMAKWLRTDLRSTVEEILTPGNLDENIFDREGVQKMWRDHLSGQRYNLNSIWAIVMWQVWFNEYFKK